MAEITTTFKQRVLQVAIKQQLSLLSDFRERISDLMANDGNVNEEEYDLQSQAFMHENTAKVNMINDQIIVANDDLQLLYRLEPHAAQTSDSVQYGALVETNKGTFFIAASLEKFIVEGMPVYGLSRNSPLFLAMRGMKANESFQFNGRRYRILKIT